MKIKERIGKVLEFIIDNLDIGKIDGPPTTDTKKKTGKYFTKIDKELGKPDIVKKCSSK